MSFDIFEKVKDMENEKASEIVLSILLTLDDWEIRAKAIEKLIQLNDNRHFQEIRSMYLNESHSEAKLKLIELLSNCYQKEGISFLKSQYKNEKDWKVRKKLIDSVGKVDKTGSIAFLIEALNDPNIEVKKSTISSLEGVNDALEPLLEILQFRNEEIYDILINNIVKIGKKADIDIIINYLNKENLNIKKSIPIILGKLKDKKAVDSLIESLNDKNPVVRKNSIKALEYMIELKDVKFIFKKLNDENIEVRKTAVKVLGSIGSKRAIRPLLELLKDKDEAIRTLAVKSLDKILIKSKSFKEVYDVLKRRNLVARREAVKLLAGATDDPDALRILIRLLNSKDARIRRLAYNAILKLKVSQDKLDDSIIEALKAKEWLIRKNSAKIVGKIGDDKTIDPLFELLNDPKSGVRGAATDALANYIKFNDSKNITKIIELAKNALEKSDWKVRRSAVNILIKIGADYAVEALIKCLNDKDVYVKSWAAKSLGKMREIKNLEPLTNLIKDNDSKIRLSAIHALGEIGDKRALEPLINAIGDDNWEVRKEIENALNRIDPKWMQSL